MWKRTLGFGLGLLLACAPVNAQQSPAVANWPGVLVAPLHNGNLCVISTKNDGPQWFWLNSSASGEHKRLGTIFAALQTVTAISASPDGKYVAVISVSDGHSVLEIVDLAKLLADKTYAAVKKIDPYPGTITLKSWQGANLHVASNMLLTHFEHKTGRMTAEQKLSWEETFAIQPVTWQITGVSDGAKNPAQHYVDILTNPQATEADKDTALTKLLTVHAGEIGMPYLLKALEQEQNPRRINMLLDEISKRQ